MRSEAAHFNPEVPLRYPLLNPLDRGENPLPLVTTLGLEMGILRGKPQDLKENLLVTIFSMYLERGNF
jgi:hypothetical protein